VSVMGGLPGMCLFMLTLGKPRWEVAVVAHHLLLPQHSFVQRPHPFLERLGRRCRCHGLTAAVLVGLRIAAGEIFCVLSFLLHFDGHPGHILQGTPTPGASFCFTTYRVCLGVGIFGLFEASGRIGRRELRLSL
jgi:hypothetical protein